MVRLVEIYLPGAARHGTRTAGSREISLVARQQPLIPPVRLTRLMDVNRSTLLGGKSKL